MSPPFFVPNLIRYAIQLDIRQHEFRQAHDLYKTVRFKFNPGSDRFFGSRKEYFSALKARRRCQQAATQMARAKARCVTLGWSADIELKRIELAEESVDTHTDNPAPTP